VSPIKKKKREQSAKSNISNISQQKKVYQNFYGKEAKYEMKSVSISQQKPKNLPTFNDFKNILTNQEQNESIMIQETHIVKITLRKERRANIAA
jgi:hypothetical protein